MFFTGAGIAHAKDKNERIRDLGYIVGRELKGGDDEHKKYYRDKDKNRIYTTKKLYENKDVIIYRGYDSKGKKYTITKRK